MEEKLNEKFESSIERIKKVAEELKMTSANPVRSAISNGAKELKKEDLGKEKISSSEIDTIERPAPQKGEMKIAETALSDLIQEKMRLEKILQELDNLKSKICQRVELIKTIEKGENELNQQLASVRKENDFSDQIKKGFENLKENIK